jgi:hypothetical protein
MPLVAALLIVPVSTFGAVILNEVDYDQIGTDASEFVEIHNTGPGPVDLGVYTLEFINGSGSASYYTLLLPSVMLPAGGYYVICGGAVPNCNQDITPDTNWIQNGAPDAIILRIGSTAVDKLSYEGNVVGYGEGTGTTAADDNVTAFLGLSRVPNGADTDDNQADWRLVCVTPGYANTADDTGCDQPVPALPTTWGRVKALY